jgi:hypothetical protein
MCIFIMHSAVNQNITEKLQNGVADGARTHDNWNHNLRRKSVQSNVINILLSYQASNNLII